MPRGRHHGVERAHPGKSAVTSCRRWSRRAESISARRHSYCTSGYRSSFSPFGLPNGAEAVALVETACPRVALKRPQFEPIRGPRVLAFASSADPQIPAPDKPVRHRSDRERRRRSAYRQRPVPDDAPPTMRLADDLPLRRSMPGFRHPCVPAEDRASPAGGRQGEFQRWPPRPRSDDFGGGAGRPSSINRYHRPNETVLIG